MGPIGAQEMILIVLVALVLFGPKKLPELGRMLGKGLSEFRRAKNELKSTFETHMQELDREARAAERAEAEKKEAPNYRLPVPEYQPASYPYPYDEDGRQSSTYESSAQPYGHVSPDNTPEPVEAAAAQEQMAGKSAAPPQPVSGTIPRSSTGRLAEPVTIPPDEESPA